MNMSNEQFEALLTLVTSAQQHYADPRILSTGAFAKAREAARKLFVPEKVQPLSPPPPLPPCPLPVVIRTWKGHGVKVELLSNNAVRFTAPMDSGGDGPDIVETEEAEGGPATHETVTALIEHIEQQEDAIRRLREDLARVSDERNHAQALTASLHARLSDINRAVSGIENGPG